MEAISPSPVRTDNVYYVSLVFVDAGIAVVADVLGKPPKILPEPKKSRFGSELT